MISSRRTATRPSAHAFTLIELLVVIAIIALLIGILVPSLGAAKRAAKVTVNLNNLHQMGLGVNLYLNDYKGWFFAHEGNYNAPGNFSDDVKIAGAFSDSDGLVSSGLASAADSTKSRRAHWADYIFEYVNTPQSYKSPMLNATELANFTLDFVKPGAYKVHKWGGYGYNFQFLGRAWSASNPAFRAKLETDVSAPSSTIVVGDSAGSRKGAAPPGGLMSNSYVIDPPLFTINTGAKTNKYYQGLDAGTSDSDRAATPVGSSDWRYRVFPAPRNNGKAGFVFADGHAATLTLKQADDFNSDGVYDNGYWNGRGDCDPNLPR